MNRSFPIFHKKYSLFCLQSNRSVLPFCKFCHLHCPLLLGDGGGGRNTAISKDVILPAAAYLWWVAAVFCCWDKLAKALSRRCFVLRFPAWDSVWLLAFQRSMANFYMPLFPPVFISENASLRTEALPTSSRPIPFKNLPWQEFLGVSSQQNYPTPRFFYPSLLFPTTQFCTCVFWGVFNWQRDFLGNSLSNAAGFYRFLCCTISTR